MKEFLLEIHVLENGHESYKQNGMNSYQDVVPRGANAFPDKDLGPVSGNREVIPPPWAVLVRL